MRVLLLFLVVMLAWGGPRAARAAITAETAWPLPARAGTWELLRITWDAADMPDAATDVCVTVQDARLEGGAGLRVTRTIRPALRTVDHRFEALIPLPLLAPAELRNGQWPVDVTLQSADASGAKSGRNLLIQRVVVEIGSTEHEAAFRVAVPRGEETPSQRAALAQAPPGGRVPVFADFSPQDILTGTPLLFASCDAVLLTPALVDHMAESRAAALLNAGVQLIVLDTDPPRGWSLVWDRLPGGAGWVMPDAALRRPAPSVLEPGLTELSEMHVAAVMAPATRWMLLLMGPAALVILALARGLARRPGQILAIAAGGMGLLAFAAIMVVRGDQSAATSRVAWQVALAQGQTASAALVCDETLTEYSPRFAQEFTANADGQSLLLPLAASVRDYFRWRAAEIFLDVPSSGRAATSQCRFTAPVEAPQTIAYLTRSLSAGGVVSAWPANSDDLQRFSPATKMDPANGWWLQGGYLFPATAPPPRTDSIPGDGELFAHWAARQPENTLAARAWYALRFQAAHRYFLRIASPAGNSATVGLELIDFGSPGPHP